MMNNMDRYSVPANREPLTLFEFCVKKAINLGILSNSNSHQAWANLIFGYEPKSDARSELMSIVKREYSAYFNEELHYSFQVDKIKKNFPYLFGIQEQLNLFDKMIKALDAEFKEQKNPRNLKTYKVLSCTPIPSQDKKYIYKAQLYVEEGDDPRFSEGMPFEFMNYDARFACEVVEFDFSNAILFFSSNRSITTTHTSHVVSDATMNTIALQKLIKEISEQKIEESLPVHKFLNGTTMNLSKVSHDNYPPYIKELISTDKSQFDAFEATINHDITFIWGPPGTGKSYTLSAVIMALYNMKHERTAVCCLSNVAVDQLLNKVVEIIDVHEPNMQRGEFYRAGRTQDEILITKEYLFPDDLESSILRKKIKLSIIKINKYKATNQQYSDEAIKEKANLNNLRENLKEQTDYLISKVKVVFSTIANFVINPRLKDAIFDNLIVDEASMLAQPQLIALARKVTKRIILVGDFQQLSPITLAGVPILRNSVFKLCGIDISHADHPALHQLLNQRRSNPKLVDLINKSFYENRLVATNKENHTIVAGTPYSGCVIKIINVKNGAVRFTKGGTRQNVANANKIMEILDLYCSQVNDVFKIGIITPYTGQVSLLKAKFLDKSYNTDFQDRVQIGTVHTFQGSEREVIIFDMVDCSKFEKGKKAYFGKIYAGEQGEQLLNVAISRAKHKLIVVCDSDFLKECPGGKVSSKSIRIFNNLLNTNWSIL